MAIGVNRSVGPINRSSAEIRVGTWPVVCRLVVVSLELLIIIITNKYTINKKNNNLVW